MSQLTSQIAKHFREIHFGGNWTCSNLKDNLADITWEEATTKIGSLNTIVTLTYHVGYYVNTVLNVFEGKELDSSDKLSFEHPPIHSQADWESLYQPIFINAEKLASFIEEMPDEKLWENFIEEKYGNYYRNLNGIIEHTHYHLGQIALIKKMIR